MAAGDNICGWGGSHGVGGQGVLPLNILNLVDLISFILVHFGDGHYHSGFRFMAYTLTCRAWKSLHCKKKEAYTYFMAIPPAIAI